ncbi:RidA family protein [Planococcus shenhongbingii]|uniref:Rid family detoxifying hydrolase n=1 Tax=Planococcus shenhongbingii TaxID=3058398 RepID=A0ABT8NC67_9BACL|nr:Rid family detoxifying hydrolase [Planococcus sp. N017]MDN7245474.1 Rid family detoxifying hydrolase [Planococcus sp. N017]
MMKFISIDGAKANPGHYSAATQQGNFLFVSGQLPVDPFTGEGSSGDIAVETKQVLANLDHILKAASAKREDIMKVTIYISDISLWNAVDSLYKRYFGEHKPARAVVPTNQLHYGYSIELEAVAYISGEKRD